MVNLQMQIVYVLFNVEGAYKASIRYSIIIIIVNNQVTDDIDSVANNVVAVVPVKT